MNSRLFPQFSGENPEVWLQKMEDLFEDYNVPKEKLVNVAIPCLRGAAFAWGFYNASRVLEMDWCAFSHNLLWEFDTSYKEQKAEATCQEQDVVAMQSEPLEPEKTNTSFESVEEGNDSSLKDFAPDDPQAAELAIVVNDNTLDVIAIVSTGEDPLPIIDIVENMDIVMPSEEDDKDDESVLEGNNNSLSDCVVGDVEAPSFGCDYDSTTSLNDDVKHQCLSIEIADDYSARETKMSLVVKMGLMEHKSIVLPEEFIHNPTHDQGNHLYPYFYTCSLFDQILARVMCQDLRLPIGWINYLCWLFSKNDILRENRAMVLNEVRGSRLSNQVHHHPFQNYAVQQCLIESHMPCLVAVCQSCVSLHNILVPRSCQVVHDMNGGNVISCTFSYGNYAGREFQAMALQFLYNIVLQCVVYMVASRMGFIYIESCWLFLTEVLFSILKGDPTSTVWKIFIREGSSTTCLSREFITVILILASSSLVDTEDSQSVHVILNALINSLDMIGFNPQNSTPFIWEPGDRAAKGQCHNGRSSVDSQDHSAVNLEVTDIENSHHPQSAVDSYMIGIGEYDTFILPEDKYGLTTATAIHKVFAHDKRYILEYNRGLILNNQLAIMQIVTCPLRCQSLSLLIFKFLSMPKTPVLIHVRKRFTLPSLVGVLKIRGILSKVEHGQLLESMTETWAEAPKSSFHFLWSGVSRMYVFISGVVWLYALAVSSLYSQVYGNIHDNKSPMHWVVPMIITGSVVQTFKTTARRWFHCKPNWICSYRLGRIKYSVAYHDMVGKVCQLLQIYMPPWCNFRCLVNAGTLRNFVWQIAWLMKFLLMVFLIVCIEEGCLAPLSTVWKYNKVDISITAHNTSTSIRPPTSTQILLSKAPNASQNVGAVECTWTTADVQSRLKLVLYVRNVSTWSIRTYQFPNSLTMVTLHKVHSSSRMSPSTVLPDFGGFPLHYRITHPLVQEIKWTHNQSVSVFSGTNVSWCEAHVGLGYDCQEKVKLDIVWKLYVYSSALAAQIVRLSQFGVLISVKLVLPGMFYPLDPDADSYTDVQQNSTKLIYSTRQSYSCMCESLVCGLSVAIGICLFYCKGSQIQVFQNTSWETR